MRNECFKLHVFDHLSNYPQKCKHFVNPPFYSFLLIHFPNYQTANLIQRLVHFLHGDLTSINSTTSHQLYSKHFSPIGGRRRTSNVEPPLDSFDMDEELGSANCANFSFTSPYFHSPEVVFADQIFSDGFLLPLHLISRQKIESIRNPFDSLDSSKPLLSGCIRSSSQNSSSALNSSQCVLISLSSNTPKSAKFKSSLARIWRRSTKKFLRKYASFLKPLYIKVKEMRLSSSSKKSSNRMSSPRTSNASVSMEWCRENADDAIHEAILHCKKSFLGGEEQVEEF